MSFRLKVDPAAPNYLTVRYAGDDVSSTRLILVVEGEMIGYLHLGDIDLLEPASAGEPQSPGRFLYRTTPLPETLTRGRAYWPIVQGSLVGGSTVVNSAIAVRTRRMQTTAAEW